MSEPTPIRAVAETENAPSAKAGNAPQKPVQPSPPVKASRKSRIRRLLFAALPIVLIAGGYVYVTGGQVMSTDNAYVQANIAGVSTDVAGTVQSISVHENEIVKAGQVLYTLNTDSFRIALDAAKAKLAAAHDDILTLQATYRQAVAGVTQAQADLPYFQDAFERQKKLVSLNTATQAAFDQAQHDLLAAQQKVDVAKTQADSALAKLGGNADLPIEKYPEYRQAKAAVDDAQRQLDHTVVHAPFDGIVTNVNAVQVGSYLQAAQAAFSLVSAEDMWIEANPKETELTYVKPGQHVTITVDAYPGVEWKGKVASVSPASESSFSLLPAQNTSGNWVKVVQRIPMRVSVEDADVASKPPLRAGMSTVVSVDTGHARGLPDFVAKLMGQQTAYAHE